MNGWLRTGAVGALVATMGAVAYGAPALPDCVKVRTSAPYRNLGYDHLVHIDNGCPATMACRVTTDVNPSPIDVDVPPHESVEVVTFRGSPARTFRASVSCAAHK